MLVSKRELGLSLENRHTQAGERNLLIHFFADIILV